MDSESNFKYLENRFPLIFRDLDYAERYLHSDPNTTMTKLRIAAESMAKEIVRLFGTEDDFKQHERLEYLHNLDLIGGNITTIFHELRKKGNQSVHEGYDSSVDAKINLKMAFNLALWFYESYGNDRTFDSKQYTYSEPENKDYKRLYGGLAKVLEDQSKRLEEKDNELEKMRAALDDKERARMVKRAQKSVNSVKLDEDETRVIIDRQLRASGWIVDSSNIRYAKGSRPAKGKNMAIAEWKVKNKRVDYALFCGLKLVGFIEAKRISRNIPSVLEESKSYSRMMLKPAANEELVELPGDSEFKVPFMFATNSRPYFKQLEQASGIWFFDGREKGRLPRALQSWFSPDDLLKALERDVAEANRRLTRESADYLTADDGLSLRSYQLKAIKAVEESIISGRDYILLTMATGTGKTRTAMGLLYRLIKAKRFRRILFLVDRSSLGIQAEESFKAVKLEQLQSFQEIYDVKFLEERFPEGETRVHIATVQGMVRRVLYNDDKDNNIFSPGQYDCILIDEAHRGYIMDREMDEEEQLFKNQSDYISKYRRVIEYFDAVKIALTATPAKHTVEIFGKAVFSYSYRQAVVDGYLIDHEPPHRIMTRLSEAGIVYDSGAEVTIFNTEKNDLDFETLEDEIYFDVPSFNRTVLPESFNRVISEELVKYINPLERGKTIIFAATDKHADDLVQYLKEAYKEAGLTLEADTVMKITGSIKDQKRAIKRFKNERNPNIAVTVDLLTTGIDVPEVTNLVFVRVVGSRILYEQMLGRATRRCDSIGKTHFNIFDAVGIYDKLRPLSQMQPVVTNPQSSFSSLIEQLEHTDPVEEGIRKRQVEEIVAKLQRKVKRIEGSKKLENFLSYSGDVTPSQYVERLNELEIEEAIEQIKSDTKLFEFIDKTSFTPNNPIISEHEDEVIGVERGYGEKGMRPEDYLEEFKRYVDENRESMELLKLLATRPKSLTRDSLRELRVMLDEQGFSETALKAALNSVRNEELVYDIIIILKNVMDNSPLISHEERIKRAVDSVRSRLKLTAIQDMWLKRIEMQLLRENIITKEDFDKLPFKDDGGFKIINKIFEGRLEEIIETINEHLYDIA